MYQKDDILKQQQAQQDIENKRADARLAIQQTQAKRVADAAKLAEAQRQQKIDYLKGINKPGFYGLKPGADKIIQTMGQYTGDNAMAKAALAAGPGTPEYEAYFKKMNELGDSFTDNSIDARKIAYAKLHPENTYALEDADKAQAAQQLELDKQAKNISDNIAAAQLKSAEIQATGGKGSSKSKINSIADLYKGSKILGFRALSGDNKMPQKEKASIIEVANTLNLNPNVVADLVAGSSKDESYFFKMMGDSKVLKKDVLLKEAKKLRDKELKRVTPFNGFGQTSVDTSKYDAITKTYEEQLKKIQAQRNGTVGMDVLQEIQNWKAPGAKAYKKQVSAPITKPSRNKTIVKLNEKLKSNGVYKTIPTNMDEKQAKKVYATIMADRNIRNNYTEIPMNTHIKEINAKLAKQFKDGKLSPVDNTLRKLGLLDVQSDAKEKDAQEYTNHIMAGYRAKKAEIKSIDEKLKANPEAESKYNQMVRSARMRYIVTHKHTPIPTKEEFLRSEGLL